MSKVDNRESRESNKYGVRFSSVRIQESLNETTGAAGAIHPAELKPADLTMVLTLSAKVLDVIFLPGTWNGFETASTYAEWNLLKNY